MKLSFSCKRCDFITSVIILFFALIVLSAETGKGNEDDSILLKQIDPNVIFKDTRLLKRPFLLTTEGRDIYVFDMETGNCVRYSEDSKSKILFVIEEEVDRHIAQNISVCNGKVVLSTAHNIYIYDGTTRIINNLYGIRQCLANENGYFAICNPGASVIGTAEDDLIHFFDNDLKLEKTLGWMFIDYGKNMNPRLWAHMKLSLVGDKLFVFNELFPDVAVVNIKTDRQKAFLLDLPFANKKLEHNIAMASIKREKGKKSKKRPPISFKVIVFATAVFEGDVYLLLGDDRFGYIATLKNTRVTELRKFSKDGFGLGLSMVLLRRENKVCYVVVLNTKRKNKLGVFSE